MSTSKIIFPSNLIYFNDVQLTEMEIETEGMKDVVTETVTEIPANIHVADLETGRRKDLDTQEGQDQRQTNEREKNPGDLPKDPEDHRRDPDGHQKDPEGDHVLQIDTKDITGQEKTQNVTTDVGQDLRTKSLERDRLVVGQEKETQRTYQEKSQKNGQMNKARKLKKKLKVMYQPGRKV